VLFVKDWGYGEPALEGKRRRDEGIDLAQSSGRATNMPNGPADSKDRQGCPRAV
jgi:hypothetical protein